MDFIDKILRTHGAMVGRMLIGLLFAFAGVSVIMNGVDSFVTVIEARGLPMASLLAWVVILIKVGAGGAMILGYKTKEAALALLGFTILATVFYHMSIEDPHLLKNLAIIGGLMYVYIYGPGPGWRLNMN